MTAVRKLADQRSPQSFGITDELRAALHSGNERQMREVRDRCRCLNLPEDERISANAIMSEIGKRLLMKGWA